MSFTYKITDEDLGLEREEVSEWRSREAVRCILKSGNKIAMLHVGRYSYHKLPGGGVEKNESLKEALKREIKEEIGSEIRIERKIDTVKGHISREETIHISHCFETKEVEKGDPNFTEQEKEDNYQIEWMTPEKAIETLVKQEPSHYIAKLITARDLKFFRETF